MPLLKIRSKYQVTLPVSIRTKLGWNIEDRVNANAKRDRIIIKKIISNLDEDNIQISIRQRFQFTLPIKIYTKFCINEGDLLEAYVDNDSLILFPRVLLVSYHEPTPKPPLKQPKANNEFRTDGLLKLTKRNKKSRKKQKSLNFLET